MDTVEREISFEEIAVVVKKRWELILLPGLVLAALVWVLMGFLPKTYESFSLIKIGSASGSPLESISSIKDIMRSLPVRQEIAKRLGRPDDLRLIKSIRSGVEYSDEKDIFKVSVEGTDAAAATKLVETISDLILERHELLYSHARMELDNLLKYVKDAVRPVPLSSGISELKVTRSEILVHAFVDSDPLPTKRRLAALLVFCGAVFICVMVSFSIEGRNK